MRLHRNILTFPLIAGIAISITASSCMKKFDSADYAPDKPFGGYSSSKEIAPNNLVAYWAFNGNLTDSAGGLTGTNNGTTFTAGKKGQALQVGGSNYYVFNSIGSVLPNLKAFTVSFWMNAPQNTSYGYGIFSMNNPTDFWGSLDIYLDNGSSADTAQFRVHINSKNVGQFPGFKLGGAWNKWVHIAITYDSSSTASTNFVVYANGNSAYSTLLKNGSANYGPLQFPGTNKMVIGTWQFQTNPSLTSGASAQGWAGSFNGALDEFRIYNKALKASDINALAKLEAAGR
ncbi:MAG: LamG domain-containing protein [Bacteroidetes bacterium]|nr:LamG domain-containing protein [Bacteroidota bacterium]